MVYTLSDMRAANRYKICMLIDANTVMGTACTIDHALHFARNASRGTSHLSVAVVDTEPPVCTRAVAQKGKVWWAVVCNHPESLESFCDRCAGTGVAKGMEYCAG